MNTNTQKGMNYFKLALAGLLRHRDPVEIAGDLRRAKAKGYTGIWIENDYVAAGKPAESHFGNNWRLFDLFDFTLARKCEPYREYLRQVCGLCERYGLDVYVSFWMPRLGPEFLAYLQKRHPNAIGRSDGFVAKGVPCLCTCEAGEGLAILERMVQQFMCDFPQVRGLKIATEDNGAYNCESNCPNAHGTSRARHAANMFATVQRAMLAVRSDAQLLLYPWFWRDGYEQEILSQLTDNYLVVTKMEQGAIQKLESDEPGEPLFDSSIVADKPGPLFLDWVKRVGSDRIVDMVPVGTGIDDFFLANPPYPGRLHRRFQNLAKQGVRRFLDFECGGHCKGSGEEAVALFNQSSKLSEPVFLRRLAGRMYRSPQARRAAIAGWRAFDEGFGKLPIGLGGTRSPGYSGRVGFAWSMCIATPLLPHMFGGERRHEIHWFSPYNFFTAEAAPRLEFHFLQVLAHWQEAAKDLAVAAALDGSSESSVREAVAAQAHLLSMRSVLHWCLGVQLAGNASKQGSFRNLMRAEVVLTEEFMSLRDAHPWIWANNCWHPHLTPLSQKGIADGLAKHKDTFTAKIKVMKKALRELRKL